MMKAKRALALIALVTITLATVFLLWKPLAASFHHALGTLMLNNCVGFHGSPALSMKGEDSANCLDFYH
jgi:hypothetical protein